MYRQVFISFGYENMKKQENHRTCRTPRFKDEIVLVEDMKDKLKFTKLI